MLKRFLKDKRGNFAIASAIALVPIMATVAAAVDYSQISRYTSNLQQALDAAALATGKKLGTLTTNSALTEYSEKFFYSNIGTLDPTTVAFIYDESNVVDGNTITLRATYNYPLLFGGILEKTTYTLNIESTVKAGNDTLEIALVLDNSGSMEGTRIATQITAATALVNQIHTAMANSNHAEPVKFSLVPFGGQVNVGTGNDDAAWIDTTGLSPTHNENLNWSEYPGAVDNGDGRWQDADGNWLTRFTLFDDMNNVSWKGCVEARPYPYMVNDEPANIGTPETLFVPVFAPDEPDDYSGEREEIAVEITNPATTTDEYFCLYTRLGVCRIWNDWTWSEVHWSGALPNVESENYALWHGGNLWYERIISGGVPSGGFDDTTGGSGFVGGSGSSSIEEGDVIVEEGYYNNYLDDWANAPSGKLQYDPAHTGTGADQNKRQAWTFKYAGQSYTSSDPFNGPNSGCTTNAITPLTSSKVAATTAIGAMQAEGATNIPLGIAWGWRTLSAGVPFDGGRPSNTPDNSKIMIVMTDGNNTYYTPQSLGAESEYNKSYYSGYGYTRSTTYSPKGRLFEAYDGEAEPDHDNDTFQAAMDEHMVELCTNAKNDGVNIYTVAFNVADESSVKDMLEICSSTNLRSGEKQYFDASGQAELLAAFETIGNDISNLRLAQ